MLLLHGYGGRRALLVHSWGGRRPNWCLRIVLRRGNLTIHAAILGRSVLVIYERRRRGDTRRSMAGPRAGGRLCGLFSEARRFVVFHDTTVLVGADLDLGAHVQLFELVRVKPSHGVRWKSLDDQG